MNDAIRCFFLEPTGRYRRNLRRFVFSSDDPTCCAGKGYHDAEAALDEIGSEMIGRDGRVISGDLWPHDDPRWPRACGCGYVFGPDDQWQLNHDMLLRRADTGELMTWHEAPAGAMRFSDWLLDSRPADLSGPGSYRGPDGHSLLVKTPGGDWQVDGRSTNGNGWTRTGTVPNVTAHPSIAVGDPVRYHGWLRDGMLVQA